MILRKAWIDRSGFYMRTGGTEWDIRMYTKKTHSCYLKGGILSSIDISQKGVLGISHGNKTTFWPPEALKLKLKDP